MLFSSIPFLYYFLPLVLAVYFLTPARFRNAVLLLASLIFYAWGEPKYVLLMLASILSGYGFGLLQEQYRGQKGAKLVCGLSVAVSLSFLLYFKYADFFLENFNAATGLGVPLLHIALPIGISFYTFQIISYTVDVYRVSQLRKTDPPGSLCGYVPQLIAGPIVPLFRHCTAVGTPFPLHRSGCRGGAALSHWIGEKDPDRQPTGRAVQRVPGVR